MHENNMSRIIMMWGATIIGTILILGTIAFFTGGKTPNTNKNEPSIQERYKDRIEDKRRNMTIMIDWRT